jgi:hypothetical protein
LNVSAIVKENTFVQKTQINRGKNMKPKTVKIGLIAVIALVSCKKGSMALDSTEKIMNSISESYDGVIWIRAASQNNVSIGGNITASFHPHSMKRNVAVGNLALNGRNLFFDPASSAYSSFDKNGNQIFTQNEIHDLFGKEAQLTLEGNIENGFKGASETVVLPTVIKITNIPKGNVLSLNSGCKLNWVPTNSDNQILVIIKWQKVNSEPDANKKRSMIFYVNDNGEFMITPKILANFDKSGKIAISFHSYQAQEIDANAKIGIVAVNTNTIGYYSIK